MLELTCICIKSPVPIHDYLVENSGLCVRLLVDGRGIGQTPFVKGNLASGTWDIPSSLHLPEVDQVVTLAVVANKGNRQKEFMIATLSALELLANVNTGASERCEFSTRKYSIEFAVTCSIKISSSSSSKSLAYQDDAHSNSDTKPNPGREELASPLQDDPEASHPRLTRIGDLEDRAHAFQARFSQSGDVADLDRAISLYQDALAATNDDDPDKASRLGNLGSALRFRFTALHELPDIQGSISLQRQGLQLTPDDHPQRPSRLSNFGNALIIRYQYLSALVDMDEAILSQQKAVDDTPDNHPYRLARLSNLGSALIMRFERLGNPADLDSAISSLQQAVNLTPDDRPHKPGQLNFLSDALMMRFERTSSLADIDRLVLTLQGAANLLSDGHPEKPSRLAALGASFHTRFDRLGRLEDIGDAIVSHQRAVELVRDGHPDKQAHLYSLGVTFQARFDRTGVITDIDSAVSILQKSVGLTPDNHADKAHRLSNLAIAHQKRFECTGSLADVEKGISSLQRALELTPANHPNNPALLSNLGTALQTRFERTGALVDINRAVSLLQKAVELAPDEHPNKAHRLISLGTALEIRFERLGTLDDLQNAVSLKQKAVELTPDDHSNKPRALSSLGTALQKRFERIGNLVDIEDAVSSLQKAVELTPDDHPRKSLQLSNLGNMLMRRFERSGRSEDLGSGTSNQQKAVELTSRDHPDMARRLNNLGTALQKRFERKGNPEDIENAISRVQLALELTPDDHPQRAVQLRTLGVALLRRYGSTGATEDLDAAHTNLSKAANSPTGPAIVRFKAARVWAETADMLSRRPLVAFGRAIDLLPWVAWLGLEVHDQHALLAEVGDVVRAAVAAAIRWGEYETAVEWAEQGRSIVWQNRLGLRTPMNELRVTYPKLANKLQDISRQLESPPSSDNLPDKTQVAPHAESTRKYSELATDWDDTVEEIRRLPNFEGFLKAKSFATLARAAYEGPVVILNVHDSRCDALVLVPDDSEDSGVSLLSIPLERFSNETSSTMLNDLRKLLSSAGVRARTTRKHEWVESPANGKADFGAILRILWQDVVKPVIEGLAYQVDSKDLPHVWWCATGSLAFLPIHAAGLCETADLGQKLSDYVISSYTPTITAILELSEPTIQEDFQLLTVAQPSTPGAPRIPKTEDEVKLVQRLVGGVRLVNLMGAEATMERVLERMKESNWIHLACHGKQNVKMSMESGFLLEDGTLELSRIIQTTLPKADFAFLSACQTATGDERVAEESVHLAAGMLLSGCRGIIATMWSIRDDDAPKIAEDVYSRILKNGIPKRKLAAHALHEAVKSMRESGAGFTSWVPFIHIGR